MKAVPLVYNLESVRERWVSALVAVAGIAGTVAVFVAMLALAHGFKEALVSSGSPDNAIVRRAGATSEMDSVISVEGVRVLELPWCSSMYCLSSCSVVARSPPL